MISEGYDFLKPLVGGEKIDIITGGAFMLCLLVLLTLFLVIFKKKLRYKPVKIAGIYISLIAYASYFSFQYLPIVLTNPAFEYNEMLVFGQMWPPLFQMNLFRDFLTIVQIYLKPFALILLFAFAMTLTFKLMRKIHAMAVLYAAITVFEIGFVVVQNLIKGGLALTYDMTIPFVEILAFAVGFLLARLFIKLSGDFTANLIDAKAKIRQRQGDKL